MQAEGHGEGEVGGGRVSMSMSGWASWWWWWSRLRAGSMAWPLMGGERGEGGSWEPGGGAPAAFV